MSAGVVLAMSKRKKRRYGSGSLFFSGGTWWLRYYVRGQRVKENSKLTNRDAAEQLLKQKVGEVAAGLIDVAPSRVTVADICALVLADSKLRRLRNAKHQEWTYRANVEPALGKISAARMTNTHIRNYIEDRRGARASEATINRELSIVRRAYTLAMREDPPLVRKAPYIPKLEEDNVRQGFIEQSQYERLLGELPSGLKAILVCGYHVGCRKNELRLLKWEQVDFEDGLIRIYGSQAKNKKPRTLPIYGDMDTWLRSQYAARPEGNPWVFYSTRKRPIGAHLLGWREACERAGLTGLLFHDLRRSAVRNMKRAGLQDTVAMSISGHRTRAVFDRYNIVDSGDIESAKKKLTEFGKLGQKLGPVAVEKKTGSDL